MEKPILAAIDQFLTVERYISAKKQGCDISITLNVSLPGRYDSSPSPKISLQASFWDGTSHQTVRAASLDELSAECLRRLGFADREESEITRLENSFMALPAPENF